MVLCLKDHQPRPFALGFGMTSTCGFRTRCGPYGRSLRQAGCWLPSSTQPSSASFLWMRTYSPGSTPSTLSTLFTRPISSKTGSCGGLLREEERTALAAVRAEPVPNWRLALRILNLLCSGRGALKDTGNSGCRSGGHSGAQAFGLPTHQNPHWVLLRILPST